MNIFVVFYQEIKRKNTAHYWRICDSSRKNSNG